MNEVLLICGMTLVTFMVRYPMLAFLGKANLPALVIRALRYAAPSVLTAIIVPAVLFPEGGIYFQIDFHNAYLIGAAVSVLVAWRTKNLLLTIIIGMAAFWLWQVLLAL